MKKIVMIGMLLLTFLLSACSLPTPIPAGPLTITLRPSVTTVKYGGCDPHVMQMDASLHGDTGSVSYVALMWSFHYPDGSLTPGATGTSELPMTPTTPGNYTWSYDFGAGPGFPYQDFVLDFDVRAYDHSGSLITHQPLQGVQWLSCTHLSAIPSVAHIYMTATLTAWDDPLYYGDCDPHVLGIRLELGGDVTTRARVARAEAQVTFTNPDGSPLAAPIAGETVPLTQVADGVYTGTDDFGAAHRGTLPWTLPMALHVEGFDYDSAGVQLNGSYRDSSGNLVSEASDIAILKFLPCGSATPTSASGGAGAAADATPTATAQLAAQVIPNLNAFCRRGPGTLYDQVSVLQKGTAYTVIGRTSQNTWWQIQGPGGKDCWVGDANVGKQGAVETLPVVAVPPLPATPAKFVDSFTCDIKAKTLGVSFNWAAAAGATGYRIYRNGSLLATVDANTTSYHDIAPLGMDLTYELEAFDAFGVAPRLSVAVPACK